MRALWAAYKLVWKRRRLRWRAFRSRHALTVVHDRTADLAPDAIRAFVCLRNEMLRLPHFLDHYRRLGVTRFLVVDNDSTDGSQAFLAEQPDVSLWRTTASYRDARFGLDWMNWLLARYGHGAWCLLVDADELLVYADHERQDLNALTRWLDGQGQRAFGALMLDMYARAALGADDAARDPLRILEGFDAGPYRATRQEPLGNLWVQGGARDRAFFADDPRRAPTLNKLPLVRWDRRFTYVNSTHSMLPRRMNFAYDGPGGTAPSGVLLHTKFLPDVVERAKEDLSRRQHFHNPDVFVDYYDAIRQMPVLWYAGSTRYTGWTQLVQLGLMSDGGFAKPD
ncbi:glycosyltransferase family 2 protein [uncultured Tateyamaria sp.]|uniref:glycosyltransferase family 2 protein n=1 Tax=uncultured Tateyamaria sp. TaxID=455651 RepID=UPI0026357FA7|nr:glycosyltransferase family 2 protein [uncultured Tateyamaria sp.]